MAKIETEMAGDANNGEVSPRPIGVGWSERVVRLLAAQPLNPIHPIKFRRATTKWERANKATAA